MNQNLSEDEIKFLDELGKKYPVKKDGRQPVEVTVLTEIEHDNETGDDTPQLVGVFTAQDGLTGRQRAERQRDINARSALEINRDSYSQDDNIRIDEDGDVAADLVDWNTPKHSRETVKLYRWEFVTTMSNEPIS